MACQLSFTSQGNELTDLITDEESTLSSQRSSQMFRPYGMTNMTIMPFGSTAVSNSVANETTIRLKWIKIYMVTLFNLIVPTCSVW
jgi:hypothetical protein